MEVNKKVKNVPDGVIDNIILQNHAYLNTILKQNAYIISLLTKRDFNEVATEALKGVKDFYNAHYESLPEEKVG